MAANKYIALITGKLQEVFGTVVSAGAANANQIVALNGAGLLDLSVMPTGISPEVIVVVASEAISAGAFVNIYNNAGVLNARNANATTNTTPAHGFVLSAVASAANATIYIIGQANSALTGLTVGSDYWLATTAGAVVSTAPATSGNIVQFLGRATSATSLIFVNEITYQVG